MVIFLISAYLLGIVVVLVLFLFLKWFRPASVFEGITNCVLSWLTVAIVISVYYSDWKLRRKFRKLSDEELAESDIEFPGGKIKGL